MTQLSSEPIRLRHNEYWGRRSGTNSTQVPKGHTAPWGNCFKLSRGGSGHTSNNGPVGRRRTRSYYVALQKIGEYSRSLGWFNGKKLKKEKLR